jgi:hypothetical protein
LVKVSGEWKIRHRRVENDHLVSDQTKSVNLADRGDGILDEEVRPPKVRFAPDSSLEEGRFEPSVPGNIETLVACFFLRTALPVADRQRR